MFDEAEISIVAGSSEKGVGKLIVVPIVAELAVLLVLLPLLPLLPDELPEELEGPDSTMMALSMMPSSLSSIPFGND